MRKPIFLIFVFCLLAVEAHAVLVGKDLNQTIVMLSRELESFEESLEEQGKAFHKNRTYYIGQLKRSEDRINSAMLSLLSQQDIYIFGQAYTAERATRMCNRLGIDTSPVKTWMASYERGMTRCVQLRQTLEGIPAERLAADKRPYREYCMKTLTKIIDSLKRGRSIMDEDEKYYLSVVKKEQNLLAKVHENYTTMHERVFLTPETPYPDVLNNWSDQWTHFKSLLGAMFSEKWFGWDYQKDWTRNAMIIILTVFITFILGIFIGRFVLRRWLVSRFPFIEKSTTTFCIMSGWTFVTLAMLFLRAFVMRNPYFTSVLSLIVEVTLLMIVLFGSVLVRVRESRYYATIMHYIPTVFITIVVVFYRIMLVHSLVLHVSFFPILVLTMLAQLCLCLINSRRIAAFDRAVGYVSLAVYVVCCILSFAGYHLLALQIVMLWSLLLSGHLALSCFYVFLNRCERYRRRLEGDAYFDSWRPFTFARLYKPMALILVLINCIAAWAHIFNITKWIEGIMSYMFIDAPGIVRISLKRIVVLILLAILVNWLLALMKYFLHKRYGNSADLGGIGLTTRAVILFVWAVYVLIALTYLEINSMGIIAALGGLTVGLGIALRDTFDCFICGLTLMMGRLKIGDVVECEDGLRGVVKDIQYRTTLIETDTGAVVSVFNTSLFDKGFKNVSRLGDYQMMRLGFRVQKNVDVDWVMSILEKNLIKDVPQLSPDRKPLVLFDSTDRFHIDMIAQVWISIKDYYEAISNVKKSIFKTLRDNNLSNMDVDSRIRILKMEGKEEDS